MAQPTNPGAGANPLDQLRDIHMPPEQAYLEIAPGWWVLIGLLLTYIGYLAYRWIQKRQRLALLKPAKSELEQIANSTPDNHALANLSALLKRICLLYYDKQQVASLTGAEWTAFLNNEVGKPLFDKTATELFQNGIFNPNLQLESNQWQTLIKQTESCINLLVSRHAEQRS